MDNTTCPNCGFNLPSSSNYCPKCGKQLVTLAVSISLTKQIGVYLLSFFLPPLGLWPAIKYLRSGDEGAKKVGLMAIILTVVSIILTIYLSIGIVNSVNQTVNSKVGFLQDLGF